MKISSGINSPAQKIKERLSIEDVVSSYIKLERSGTNLKAKCPFHNEKTPSFFISPERESYYCFGCGAKGDIFSFVEEFEGLDFKGALKLLASRAGIVLENFNPKEESEKEKLYRAMEQSTKFFENNLSKNFEALEYLKSRGLKDETIKDFRIGFVPDAWRELYSYLKQNGFTDVEMEKAGLVKKADKGFYDRFRGRIMFPIADSSGRIIAFSGRIFGKASENSANAKYLNSPDTPIFSKSSVLFGLDKAKDSIRRNNFTILVEGQMDLILSHQVGYKNTIASSGTALSDSTVSKENVVSNLGLIRRLTDNIVLAFDADRAGFNASNRAAKIALSLGMDVKIASMPDGVDPADLIGKEGLSAWKLVIKEAKHIIEFLLDKLCKIYGNDIRKLGKEVKNEILPYVNLVESSIEKMYFVRKIADVTSIPESSIKEDLKNVEQDLKQEKKEIEDAKDFSSKIFRKDYIEKRLLGIVLWQKTLTEQVVDTESILKDLASIFNSNENTILEKVSDIKEDLIFEAEVFYGANKNLEKDTKELLSNLKEEYLKEELFKKMQELHHFEMNKDTEGSARALKEIHSLNNRIQEIKNGRSK